MTKRTDPPGVDWKADFDSVRLHQMQQFRALPLRDKIQAMEDMAEIVKAAQAARERAKKKKPAR